jgi:hypothetical protein
MNLKTPQFKQVKVKLVQSILKLLLQILGLGKGYNKKGNVKSVTL